MQVCEGGWGLEEIDSWLTNVRQLSTKNYKVPPEPVTKSKLIQEVSKRIRWHTITDLETNSSVSQQLLLHTSLLTSSSCSHLMVMSTSSGVLDKGE